MLGQNGDHFYEYLSSQVDNGISWLSPWFRRSKKARRIDDDRSVYVKVMQALFLTFPEILDKLSDPDYDCPNQYCLDNGCCPSDGPHKLSLHDPFGHFTLFGPGNKANVLGEKFSSDKFIYNTIMEYTADETKTVKGISFARESSLAFRHPIFFKPSVDGSSPADTEELHVDGIATFENTNVFLEFSRCSASSAKARVQTKLHRLADIASKNETKHCVIVLTKPEGQIFEEGSFKFFEEYGKQVAHSRYTRERPDENPLDRYDDATFAKVQATRLKTMVRAISRTLQTRCLDVFLRSLSSNRAQPPPWATKVNPARLTDLQRQSLSPDYKKKKKAGAAEIRKVIGRILANGPNIGDEDGCAVRFTGPPCRDKTEKRITVSTMKALLHSKSLFLRRDTPSTCSKDVRERAE